jgi:DeoR family transcriptional regulator, aga operon transcriptional repressor
MRQADRLNAIVERLARDGSVAVRALSEGLGVSEASVRRDLALLENQQWLSRTHGGAVALGRAADVSRAARMPEVRHEHVMRIARIAAERVSGYARIALTGGPLALAIGRALGQREDVTVATNALQVAYELSLRRGINVIVPGGMANGTGSILGGPLTDMALQQMRFDVVLVGGDGIAAEAGLTAENEAVGYAARSFIAVARRIIAVVDAPAVGETALHRICAIDEIHELVTAEDLEPQVVRALRSSGLRVTTG